MILLLCFLLLLNKAEQTQLKASDNITFNAMPEELLKKWMMDLSFNESLAFALAIRPSDAINPLKSNTLNPLTYHDPELDDYFALRNVIKADIKDRRIYIRKLMENKIMKKIFKRRLAWNVQIQIESIIMKDLSALDILLEEGFQPGSDFFIRLIRNGNLSMLGEFVKRKRFPDVYALLDSVMFNNEAAVKYLLSLDYSWSDLTFVHLKILANTDGNIVSDEIKKMIKEAKHSAMKFWGTWRKYGIEHHNI